MPLKLDSTVAGGPTVSGQSLAPLQSPRKESIGGNPGRMKLGSPEAIRFTKGLVVCALFGLLIWLPALDSAFHLDHAPIPNEKRQPAPFPEFRGLTQSRDFLSGLTAWFDDHFGYRRRLVRANNHWKHQLFGASEKEVLEGRDGWLYFTDGNMLDNCLGHNPFTQKDLNAWQRLLEKRRDWLAQRGCKYLFVIAPDKHSVYPEHLPEWCEKAAKPGRADQFFERMKSQSTVMVADLRPALKQAKAQGFVYWKTDSHWDALGAFTAYQSIIEMLSRATPMVKPLPLEAFERGVWHPAPGDLAILMGDAGFTEPEQITFTPRPPLTKLEAVKVPDLLPKKWLKDTEPVITRNEAGHGKAMVFRDSFGEYWLDLIGQHFKETIYIWESHLEPELIEREKPDVVITEMVERVFNTEQPEKLTIKDRLGR